MIRAVDGGIEVTGPISMAAATGLLIAGEAAIAVAKPGPDKSVTFNLASATELDSSCLALIFALMRAAKLRGLTLRLLHAPQNLMSLAAVYDVTDLLPA